jgi:hypothetical protein
MASASQELTLRVRGDNSGADKAINDTAQAVKRLHISGEKARGAFSNFSRTLTEARTGADVAAGAADSLAQIIGKSLVGAVAVGSVKIFTDQLEKMGEMVKATAVESAKAFDDISKSGGAIDLAQAQSQVKGLETNIAATQLRLTELDRSPFQNFIAGATGARKEMEALNATQQRVRDFEIAAGMMSQNINEEKLSKMSDEEKQLEAINQQYRDRQKFSETIESPKAREEFSGASASKFARQRNAELDKQAKALADKELGYQEELAKAEMAAAKYEREFKEKSDKNLAESKRDQQERSHKEEMYDIQEAAKLEEANDRAKFNRLMRDAVKTRDESKKSEEDKKNVNVSGILGASAAGRQATDAATRRRAQQLKVENARTADQLLGTEYDAKTGSRTGQQRDREKLAAMQAASAAPSLAEQLTAKQQGIDPAQLASANAAKGFESERTMKSEFGPAKSSPEREGKDINTKLLEAINKLTATQDAIAKKDTAAIAL